MARYTITPWRTHADLLAVRSEFYNLDTDSPDARRKAVDRVLAWKLRTNLPHAVESTALLVDATLHQHTNNRASDPGSNSSWSVRAVYAAAFTRFVTGFCDIGRAREGRLGGSEASMLTIAAQIGMPPEFVGLRHEATHEELPSLRRLMGATDQALGWLWQVYWSRLEEPTGEGAVDLAKVREEARRVFRNYRSTRREALKWKKHTTTQHGDAIKRHCDEIAELCQANSTACETVAEVIVKDKLLYSSSRVFGEPMAGAFAIWDPLIFSDELDLNAFTAAFARSLVNDLADLTRLNAEKSSEAEATYLWLVRIAHRFEIAEELPLDQPKAKQQDAREDMMKWCCLYPGYWSRRLGEAVLENADFDFSADWKDVFEASLLSAASGSTESRLEIDAAPIMAAEQRAVASELEAPTSAWRRAPVPPSAPIGVVS